MSSSMVTARYDLDPLSRNFLNRCSGDALQNAAPPSYPSSDSRHLWYFHMEQRGQSDAQACPCDV